jgi:hypothetical protein
LVDVEVGPDPDSSSIPPGTRSVSGAGRAANREVVISRGGPEAGSAGFRASETSVRLRNGDVEPAGDRTTA